ncbi:MAG: phosphonate C-P lyase system protein PhnH [Cyanobacteria bacterium]|nr:phosphonate C-P lyase system protein PhnH [Cyanobacteriota bacterium]MDA0867617.1 phosphonate C-P lyase system protein PhnH [Cyanobacteriota bacterium]
MITQLPGFQDAVHDSQRTFRSLLDALARPGLVQTTAPLTPPEGLVPSCAAASLTLLDLETTLWLQAGIPEAVGSWLLFHTGCRFTADPHQADFALITDWATAPALAEFKIGTPEYPEASTALLIQLPTLAGGESVTLQGPGIREAITVDLPVGDEFWSQWQAMTEDYPMGIDAWCFAGEQVVGLPRTSRLRAENQEGAS